MYGGAGGTKASIFVTDGTYSCAKKTADEDAKLTGVKWFLKAPVPGGAQRDKSGATL